MSKANRDWHEAMQRAFVTMEDCTCPSKDHPEIRPHDDDCPTELLRDQLTSGEWPLPQPGRIERVMMAVANLCDPLARQLTARLGERALPIVGVVLAGWLSLSFWVDGPPWMAFAMLPVSMYLGGVAGTVLSQHVLLVRARRALDAHGQEDHG